MIIIGIDPGKKGGLCVFATKRDALISRQKATEVTSE